MESLNTKLRDAELNAPRERRAQVLANIELKAKKEADPSMTKGDEKKEAQKSLVKYRDKVGAKRSPIEISDREWEAIQAGAISSTTLSRMLKYTDVDSLRERATPRSTTTLSQAKINKIQAMSSSNHSLSEIAKACGVSTSTVSKYLKGAS